VGAAEAPITVNGSSPKTRASSSKARHGSGGTVKGRPAEVRLSTARSRPDLSEQSATAAKTATQLRRRGRAAIAQPLRASRSAVGSVAAKSTNPSPAVRCASKASRLLRRPQRQPNARPAFRAAMLRMRRSTLRKDHRAWQLPSPSWCKVAPLCRPTAAHAMSSGRFINTE
jgi:hypothetical protein